MTTYQFWANLIAYFVFLLGPWLTFPSRYNVPATTNIPFLLTAYLLPLSILPYDALFAPESIELLTMLNIVGAFTMLVGLFVGARLQFGASALGRYLPRIQTAADEMLLIRRLRCMLAIGVIGMVVCFIWMGMVPMFAENPLSAKFFKGSYKERYDQISILYRFSEFAVATLMPLGIAVAIEKRDRCLIILMGGAIALMTISLNRGLIGAGVLAFLAIWATKSLGKTVFVTCLSSVLVLIGSLLYLFLGIVDAQADLAGTLTWGAPDISDQLTFLSSYAPSTDQTYGLTFIAGLLPGSHPFSPPTYALRITNPGTDISDIASGGFRLSPSIWGYVSFSWVGVILVCLVSGLILGGSTSVLRRMKLETSLTNKMLLVMWYSIVPGFLGAFYAMSYTGLLSLAIFLIVCGPLAGRSFLATNLVENPLGGVSAH